MTGQQLMPEQLGGYRLLSRLGEGGMGVVFRAEDAQGRAVALKVLRSSVAGESTARRRMAREVETMQRVRSPYVAEVMDADLTGDTPYIVTRYVPGCTLDEVVATNGPIGGTVLARVAFGLAEALAAVHAAGVVHRDLKPGNVMMLDGAPVVIDFGIAQGPDATRLTLTGMFMGTPGYLAPEVIEGQPSSEASDIHAWGATLAFAATGRPPYGSGQYETIFYRIVNGKPDLAGIPSPLLPLVTRALARDPAHRPTAVQLGGQAAALDAVSLVPGPTVTPAATPGAAGGATPVGATLADGAASPALAGNGAALPGAGVPSGVAGAPGLAVVPGTGAVPGADVGTVGPGALAGGALAGSALAETALARDGVTALAPGGASAPPAPAVPETDGYGPTRVAPGLAWPGGGMVLGPGTRPMAVGPGSPEVAELLPPVRYALDNTLAPGSGRRGVRPGSTPALPDFPGSGALAAGRWDVVLVIAAMVLAASISVLMPVAGTLAALALIACLRAGGLAGRRAARRRAARGSRGGQAVRSVVMFPLYLVRALGGFVLLVPFALAAAAVAAGVTVAFVPGDWPLRAIAYATGAAVAFYGLGPGSGPSRWQLGRIYDAMSASPAAQGLALTAVGVVSVAAFTAAITWPSYFWPLHTTGGFLSSWGFTLGPLPNLGLLQHLNLAHRVSVISSLVRHLLGL
ncbi:MAG TPA: serine/threonine-protein kinase [Streptosporangiaceae bacterium]|nr:serine/threonine-protein kinase [Streptosporangiaceae bacterium]